MRALQAIQASIEANPDSHVTIHVDFRNAFNTLLRDAMLQAVYGEDKLKLLWRVFSFSYSDPSLLLLREHGVVVDSLLSQRGVKQGCTLASLGFAIALQPHYLAALDGSADIPGH